MQILTNTPEKLVLEERYTFFGGASWFSAMTLVYGMYNKWPELDDPSKWAMGATCLGFIAIAVYFLRPSIFEFDRNANHFRWTKPGLFKSHYGETPLDQIKRVRVDADYSDATKAYRVLVETQSGKIPFQHCYTTSKASDHHQIVEMIRNWLGH